MRKRAYLHPDKFKRHTNLDETYFYLGGEVAIWSRYENRKVYVIYSWILLFFYEPKHKISQFAVINQKTVSRIV